MPSVTGIDELVFLVLLSVSGYSMINHMLRIRENVADFV